MTEVTSSFGLRDGNRLRVVEELYRQPCLSRTDLARVTRLSRATVSALVDELVHAGIVEEHDSPEDARPRSTGRPPILLSLVPSAAFAVGLDVGHEHIRVAVCDLSGTMVGDSWSTADVDCAPDESLDLAQELVQDALDNAPVDRERVLGVGMGLAAPVNKLTGELEAAGIMPGWAGVRPAAEMETRLDLPVSLENDANLGAFGEHVFGAARGVPDLVYVRLSAGIGAGLILGGRPYQGACGVAGEIGHAVAVDQGLVCRCGSRGCLETVASPGAIAAMLRATVGSTLTVEELLELVAAGDRGACRAVADAGEAVGRTLSILVNTLNPRLLVIGGDLAPAGDVLLKPLRAAIDRHAVAPAADCLQVVRGTLGPRAEVLGAAALALAQAPPALVQRIAGH